MSSMTVFIIFVAVIAVLFLFINLVFAPHNPYQEKDSTFECGFHSFLGQNRTQFGAKFVYYGFLYLIVDMELIVSFPYAASAYENGFYGLIMILFFMIIITLGFVFELGKQALKIDNKQTQNTDPLLFINVEYINCYKREAINLKKYNLTSCINLKSPLKA